MKQLDTHTVLEIIKMLDVKICYIEDAGICDQYDKGVFNTLYDLRDHLQSYIEAELNAAELNTGE